MRNEGKKMKTRARRIPFLTDDLLMNILSRLPVKHVLRFRSVSKPWLSLLTQPTFTKLHFNQPSHLKTYNLLLENIESNPLELQILNCDFLDKDGAEPKPYDLPLNNLHSEPDYEVRVVGSCNGLFCLSSEPKPFISLLNPATREHIPILLPPIDRAFQTEFGYVPDLDKYKVVAMTPPGTEDGQVWVYTIGGSSWRRVEVPLPPSPNCLLRPSCAGHLNGVLHWLDTLRRGHDLYVSIVSFDLKTEKFGEIALPDFNLPGLTRGVCEPTLVLEVFNGCLVLFSKYETRNDSGERTHTSINIWMMKVYGMKDSWVKIYSFGPPLFDDIFIFNPFFMRNNGDILVQSGCGEIVLYNPVASTREVLIGYFDSKDSWDYAYAYIESLTSIAALMAGNRMEAH